MTKLCNYKSNYWSTCTNTYTYSRISINVCINIHNIRTARARVSVSANSIVWRSGLFKSWFKADFNKFLSTGAELGRILPIYPGDFSHVFVSSILRSSSWPLTLSTTRPQQKFCPSATSRFQATCSTYCHFKVDTRIMSLTFPIDRYIWSLPIESSIVPAVCMCACVFF